jgi:plastocyanin
MRIVALTIAVGVTLTACGSDGSNVGPAASQLAFTVQPSVITAGQAISPAIQVSIEDGSGNVVTSAETPITLALEPSSTGATLGGTTTVSAGSGVATFADLQISKPGTGYTLSASAPDLAIATSTAFDVTAAPGVATTIVPLAGQSQSGTVGQLVGTSPTVRVTDGLNSPVANVTVTFEVTGGGGSVSEGEQTTGADGVATLGQWTLGALAGSNTLLATAAALQGSPVSFTAVASAGPAAKMALQAGDDQTTFVGTAVAEAPAVLATDIYDNPVSDVPVRFRVASGGGRLVGGLQTTGADGIARVESWTVGERPGPNTLTATSAELVGSPVSFSATAAATGAIVEVRNNYFRSLQNGSGSPVNFSDRLGKPARDTISPGQTVTWVWVGQGHNVTRGSSEPETHDAPHTFSVTFDSAGAYLYRCTNHSFIDPFFEVPAGMQGIIAVR